MANVDTLSHVSAAQPPAVRRITTADLDWALRAGWDDFKARRGDLILAGLLYPAIGFLAAILAFRGDLLPLLFPMVAGVSLLGPAAAAGFYEIAKRREEGRPSGWDHFLDPLKGRTREPLAMLTLLLGALFVGWLGSAWLIYQATLGGAHAPGMGGLLSAVFGTSQGWAMLVLGNLVGLLFAVVALMVAVASFPMVIDRPVDAGTAVQTSVRAVRANFPVVAQWGLRVAALLALGALPLFIGLAIVLPLLGYSTWHLYTRLVER